jgi:hypothetical membrane protein
MRVTNRALAGLFLFIGAAQFVVGMLVAEATYSGYPAYNIRENAISDLGVGSTALLFNVSVFLVGVFTILGADFLHRVHRRMLFTIPFLLAGIGAIGVGLFPENVPTAHEVSALIAFLFGGIAAIVAYPLEKEPLNYISVLLGILGLMALGLFVSGVFMGLGFGGMERMIIYPVLLWEVSFGGYLVAAPDEPIPAVEASAAPPA